MYNGGDKEHGGVAKTPQTEQKPQGKTETPVKPQDAKGKKEGKS
jgi:hypothetical protein